MNYLGSGNFFGTRVPINIPNREIALYLYSAVTSLLLTCVDWSQDELNQMSVKHGFSNVPVTKDEVSRLMSVILCLTDFSDFLL